MYNSGYSQASKFNLQAQRKMKQRQKGKSCGYYMRIIFFFSSLIQSLIIVSLVLFLVYGKQADSASATRIHDLEQSFSSLSIENVDLRLQRINLTQVLNVTLTEKMWNDRALLQLRYLANTSYAILKDLNAKMTQCNMELQRCKLSPSTTNQCPTGARPPIINAFGVGGDKGCETRVQHLSAMIQMVQSNFTQTSQMMRMEMDQIAKERDHINLDAIHLRRDKATLEKELAAYRVKCKEDFAQSLSGISNVSRAFLGKIDSLFPHHIPFQLTCEKQRENLEQIRNNCTSLSREVEDKFQRYLDNVGAQVSRIQDESSRLKAENWRLREDHGWCSRNRTGLIQEHRQNTQKLQLKCDQAKEKLLMEKKRLSGDKELQDINLKVKDGEIQHLKNQLKQLNASCALKGGVPGGSGTGLGTGGLSQFGPPWNKFGGSSSLSSAAGNAFGKTGLNFGSTGSNTGLGSTGFGLNKPGLTGIGSSNPGTGLGQSKPGAGGIGSLGLGSNRSSSTLGSTWQGSSKLGSNGLGTSSLGSTGLGSTGLGAGKKPGTGQGLGTGLGSTGLSNTGLSNTGLGSNSLGSTKFGNTGLGGTGGLGSTGRTGTGGTGLGSWPGTGTGLGSSSTGLGGLGTGSTGLGNRGGTGLGSTGTGGWNTGGSTGFGGTGTSGLGNKGSTGLGSTGTGGWGSTGGNVFKGLGSSSTGLGSTGLATGGVGRGTGGLGGFGGTGSSFGGLGGTGTVNILQHLQDLQRYANAQGVPKEKKQDQSRMFGR